MEIHHWNDQTKRVFLHHVGFDIIETGVALVHDHYLKSSRTLGATTLDEQCRRLASLREGVR